MHATRVWFLLASAAVIPSACDLHERAAPTTLMDGTPVREAPAQLEGVDRPTVLTTARVSLEGGYREGSASAACLQGRHRSLAAGGLSIERVGVDSESVTLRESSGRGIIGCDNSLGWREENRRWCGSAYGVLHAGRLRDPRLSIGCRTRDGTPLGFVWIEPQPTAGYVVVEQPGYAEVYEVAGGLPVRVATTTGVEIEGSRANIDLREHAADGSLLKEYRLETAVSG
jgi:hypothetical protein